MNISPARWTRRAWIAAFMIPGALALSLTACAPFTPSLEDALAACTEYIVVTLDADAETAQQKCEDARDELGDKGFIKVWTD